MTEDVRNELLHEFFEDAQHAHDALHAFKALSPVLPVHDTHQHPEYPLLKLQLDDFKLELLDESVILDAEQLKQTPSNEVHALRIAAGIEVSICNQHVFKFLVETLAVLSAWHILPNDV